MMQPFRATSQTDSDPQKEPPLEHRFDYSLLPAAADQRVRRAAQHIRLRVQRTVEDVLAIGKELLTVKETLRHGQFCLWLRAEFNWTERTARRFMAVAQRFGSKKNPLSVLKIDLTAAYLLAAPSVPPVASETALERAKSGERITVSVAKAILYALENKPSHRARTAPTSLEGKLLGQLIESLESFRLRWHPQLYSLLACQLRDFADSLEDEQPEC